MKSFLANTSEPTLGQEIAKSLILSAATTAGMWIGMAAVGMTVEKVKKIRAKKATKATTK